MPSTITVRPWPDPVIDTLGHDARSIYAEVFWLPTLGPSTVKFHGCLAVWVKSWRVYVDVVTLARLERTTGRRLWPDSEGAEGHTNETRHARRGS